MVSFALGKTVLGGKLHVRSLTRYQMCTNGTAAFQHLQIFNYTRRNANRIMFIAKCLLNGWLLFPKHAPASPSSPFFPYFTLPPPLKVP